MGTSFLWRVGRHARYHTKMVYSRETQIQPIEKQVERRAETDPTEWLTATEVNLRLGTWNNKTRQAIRFPFTSEKRTRE